MVLPAGGMQIFRHPNETHPVYATRTDIGKAIRLNRLLLSVKDFVSVWTQESSRTDEERISFAGNPPQTSPAGIVRYFGINASLATTASTPTVTPG